MIDWQKLRDSAYKAACCLDSRPLYGWNDIAKTLSVPPDKKKGVKDE